MVREHYDFVGEFDQLLYKARVKYKASSFLLFIQIRDKIG